jgi:sulfite exporter TauE/SafE
MKALKEDRKQGIGLYTYAQRKNTTPFQYFAQVVVGTVVALLGIALGYFQYQSPTRSAVGIVTSVVFIVVGIFIAHAGAIFWYKWLRKSSTWLLSRLLTRISMTSACIIKS